MISLSAPCHTDSHDNRQKALADIADELLHQQNETDVLAVLASLSPRWVVFHSVELTLPDAGKLSQQVFISDDTQGRLQTGAGGYCVMPLNDLCQFPGELGFIRKQGNNFTRDELLFLRQVSCLAGGVLLHISLLTECHQLRDQRDHFRILVDITNSVLSHLEMDALVAEVSHEINHFFGINYIAMILNDAEKNGNFSIYSSYYDPGHPVEREQRQSHRSGSLVEKILHSRQVQMIDLNDAPCCEASDAFFDALRANHITKICLLPLSFTHQPLGVLVLAHPQADFFHDGNVELLGQIAARIGIAVDNAAAYGQISQLKDTLQSENIWLNARIQNTDSESDIIYQSKVMRSVLEQVEMVASSDSTVLILGETGTGKELIARAIHKMSLRNKEAMIKMNCAAVPSGLLESDLFGHEKGAFTGATTVHIGRFEVADGGTLFLDEIGDMPLELQPKLLRVLQEREIERIGSNKVIPVNVRLIAATNRDLKQMSLDREFRSDLYYRLNVFPISIPPLRERPEDIPLLAKFFTQKIARRMKRHIDSIPADALRQLSRYPWPGNVRELENVIERAVILTRGRTLNIQLHELQHAAPLPEVKEKPVTLTPPPETDEEERKRIVEVLRETNGIVAGPRGAAIRLGLKRTTLLSRMQRLGISVHDL